MSTTVEGKPAGVVVLFHPDAGVIDAIRTYAGDLGALFAVDNTPQADPELVTRLAEVPNVEHIPLNANLGVAAALNTGVRACADAGYAEVLLMDQDTKASPGMVAALAACLRSDPRAAMACAFVPRFDEPDPDCSAIPPAEVRHAITAGSLMRVAAWHDAGPFMEELFIDLVDTEYDLRLLRAGYSLLKATGAVLVPTIGDPVVRRVLGKRLTSSNHPPLRRYYSSRNLQLLKPRYAEAFPQWWRTEVRRRLKDTLLVVLLEPEKLRKLRMMALGRRDGRRGVTGPFGGERA